MAESMINLTYQFRVLVFKEAPEVVYTGLTKIIGKPRELEKNIEDESYFENKGFDINIPVEESEEYQAAN